MKIDANYINFSMDVSFEENSNRNIQNIEVQAKIINDDDEFEVVATIKLIKVISILKDSDTLFYQFDSISDEMLRCFESCIEGGDNFNRIVGDSNKEFNGMIYIDELRVVDKYKRFGLGKVVVQEVVRLFGKHDDALIVLPYPIDAKGNEQAHLKVINFWESVGFNRIGNTDFWLMPSKELSERKDFINETTSQKKENYKFEPYIEIEEVDENLRNALNKICDSIF